MTLPEEENAEDTGFAGLFALVLFLFVVVLAAIEFLPEWMLS